MRAGLDHGKLAVAVRQRLGGPGQPLFRPGGIAERAAGADLDGLSFDVDLAGLLPVLADGLVRRPGVMCCHSSRIVIIMWVIFVKWIMWWFGIGGMRLPGRG